MNTPFSPNSASHTLVEPAEDAYMPLMTLSTITSRGVLVHHSIYMKVGSFKLYQIRVKWQENNCKVRVKGPLSQEFLLQFFFQSYIAKENDPVHCIPCLFAQQMGEHVVFIPHLDLRARQRV